MIDRSQHERPWFIHYWNAMASRRWLNSIGLFLLAALVGVLFLQTFRLGFDGKVRDLRNYLDSAQSVSQGNDPYELGAPLAFHKCPYPMFLAFAMIPFTWLPFPAAGTLWFALNGVALVLSAWLWIGVIAKKTPPALYPAHWFSLFLFAALCFIPIQNNFRNGQVNAMVLLLCVLSFWGYQKDKSALAGFSLAAAIAIKLLPLPLLGFYLIRRRWKIVGLSILGEAAFCMAPMALLKGHIFTAYYHYIHDFLLSGSMSEHAQKPWRVPMTLYDIIHYVSSFEGYALRVLTMFVLAASTMLLDWKIRHKNAAQDAWIFAIYLASALLIAPISEKHHLILLFPLFLLFYRPCLDTENSTNFYNPLMLGLMTVFMILEKSIASVPWYAFGVMALWIAGWINAGQRNPQ